MDWWTVLEKFGWPALLVVGVAYGLAWIAKRLFGEAGIVSLAAGRLFGENGLAERLTGKYLSLMEALESASRRTAEFQAASQQFQVDHAQDTSRAREVLEVIRDNTAALAAAGLHGCELLEQVERELQANNSSVNWRPHLERIRESLRGLVV